MRKSLISLGDALRAVKELKPSDKEARGAIMAMLGLDERETATAPRSIGAWKPSSGESLAAATHRKEISPAKLFEAAAQPKHEYAPVLPRRIPGAEVSRTLEGIGTLKLPPWLIDSTDLLGSESDAGPPPETPELFGRVVKRGILSATIATTVKEGELDFPQIMRTLGERRLLRELPRLRISTLRRGVQVLIDRSDAMTPFQQDQDSVVKALDDVLADDRLEVLNFAGTPLRNAGVGARSEWSAWKPPVPPTPILVVSDLGVGGSLLDDDRASQGEWLRFAAAARSHGNLVICLVPYQALRWPSALTRVMRLVHWSEKTTAGEVRRALRDIWRVHR